MLPVLKAIQDGREWHVRDVIDKLAEQFKLTEAERAQRQPSGTNRLFDNRVHWAKKYLKEAKLLTAPRRAHVQLSDRGAQLLQSQPASLNTQSLREIPEFADWENKTGSEPVPPAARNLNDTKTSVTPEDQIEAAYVTLRNILAEELLDHVKSATSDFFEQLVVDLLLKMGYGGSRTESGHTTQRSGDDGIDGTIYEDRLGLDIIYLQAKRWTENTIGRPEIQKFVGALQGQRARKGIFITTSQFSREAVDYVSRIEPRVVLIDGKRLAELMIDFGIGVSTSRYYELKRVDIDYFEVE